MGKVYLVGAGPGDPELITVKGMRAIQEADVILYDRLINKELLTLARPHADLIYCGKLPNYHTMKQETINKFLVKHALAGKIVTRLKGGDPFVFGRGGEEAQAVAKHGIPFEIVPGVTAGIAAAAYAGIPVTHREHAASFALVTGHRKDGEEAGIKWESLARGVDTLAIYMGVKNIPYIQEQLLTYGKSEDTPVALIQWGTMKEQRTITTTLGKMVEDVAIEPIKNPTLIVIGDVVRMRDQLAWYEKRTPLVSKEA